MFTLFWRNAASEIATRVTLANCAALRYKQPVQIIHGIENIPHSLEKIFQKPVITIGNFDGVHLGHRHIIQTTIQEAQLIGGSAIAFTFRPHPQEALHPEKKISLLTTYDEKLEILGSFGLDAIIEQPFSREFSFTESERFFNDVLLRKLSVQTLVVGYDFSFGKERSGHIPVLETLCKGAGVKLVVVPPHKIGNEIMSSSRIREHLLNCELAPANGLMGRPFFYRGIVQRGLGRGRKLGFPTANLKLENKLTLPFGVYATRAILKKDAPPISSVTNIGVRPTFADEGLPALVETHLLDTDLDLYGSVLEVQFIQHLRSEKHFATVHDLTHQINLDILQARQILVPNPAP